MVNFSIVQFEDEEGKRVGEVLHVPLTINAVQLKSLVNTTQDIFVNGVMITDTLESCLSATEISNVEEVKKIKIAKALSSARPAFYCSSTYSGHQGPVLCTRFAHNILATSGGDRTVRFWDLLTKTQFKIVEKHTHWVVCLDHDDKYIVSGGMDGVINIFDHEGGHIRTLARHKDGISALRISNGMIVSCSRDATCIVWGIDGDILKTWNHSRPIRSLCVTDDLIVTGGTDNRIVVYKSLKYHCDLAGHGAQINCIDALGDYIVSGDDNGHIILWKDFQPYRRFQHKREVISVCFNPNGLSFASGSFDRTVQHWSVESGLNLNTYYHVGFVYKVRVYNDLIVSCSKDKTVKMFRISKNKVVSDLVCEDEVYDFDYFDGHLVCGSKNSKVYFFN